MNIIYVRGGDSDAPKLAAEVGWLYGVRYNYTAYGDVYMLDGGLRPRWARYIKRANILKPAFALAPDYFKPDHIALELYIQDIRAVGARPGVCPKFSGALAHIPEDAVICESIPSSIDGYIIPDDELLPGRDYHLLGGDPRYQLREIKRIHNAGGNVISLDGNKLMLKATHGQVFNARLKKWQRATGTTPQLARISAGEITEYLMVGRW